MSPSRSERTITVSAKLPATLAAQIDTIARYRAVSRSYLIRELAEAAVDGRVIFNLPPQTTFSELGASDVGRAARRRAQSVAAAACRDAAAAREVDAATLDVESVAREMQRRLATGRKP